MSSLKDRIELLENDLKAVPSRISVYHDLPFAILRYDRDEEWNLRREVKLLATRLETTGKKVHLIPMSDFLWKAIEETEGLDEIVALEQSRGYLAAQDQVTTYLSDRDWRPLASEATIGMSSGKLQCRPCARGDGEYGNLLKSEAVEQFRKRIGLDGWTAMCRHA